MLARILLLLTLACLFMTASSTRVGFQPRSRSTSVTAPETKTSTTTPATTPILPVRALNHVTRTKLVERKRNPKAKRATTSATPFPASDCSGYTSTGTVPWAVYTNLDIDDPTSPNVGGITSREACRQRCQASSTCVADTWQTNQICYSLQKINGYFPTYQNGWQGATRGKTCAQNAQAVATSLTQRGYNYKAGTDYTCCTQYRAA